MRTVFTSLLFFILFAPGTPLRATSYTVDILATVPGCGDGVLQVGEDCDGGNIGGASCESIGFDSGVLACSSACTFLTNSCTFAPTSTASQASRIIPRDSSTPLPETNVVVAGFAAPDTNVSLLKDGIRVATVPVRSDGTYQITVSGLSLGLYRMQVVGFHPQLGVARSDVFTIRVLQDATTKISGVIVPPIVALEVNNNLQRVRGLFYRDAEVELFRNNIATAKALSDAAGSFGFDVTGKRDVAESLFVVGRVVGSDVVFRSQTLLMSPQVTEQEITRSACELVGDINNDCRVDVVDFVASRWRFVRAMMSERFDFNDDGIIDLVDFSILAYHWTG